MARKGKDTSTDSSLATRQLSPNKAKASILHALKIKRPIFLWGGPGIGKSDVVRQIAKTINAHVIDIRLSLWEPTDIKGIPYFNSNSKSMEWASPSELPDEKMSKKYKNIILFLDEMNSAAPSVQAAAYQLILNRKVGTYELPENVVIVAAGNREADKGITYRMPAPLANRFIHLEMKPAFDDWFEWAVDNKIHKDVIGYLTFSKKDLYDFEPKSSSRSFATPRSWSFVSELLSDDLDENTVTDLVSGAVGEGLAVKFMAHRKVASQLPNPSDILEGKEACDKKDKKFNDKVGKFLRFMMDNFDTELVVMGIKLALTQYQLPFDPDAIKVFDEFHEKYGKYITAAQSAD